jgi:hypothetical protein
MKQFLWIAVRVTFCIYLCRFACKQLWQCINAKFPDLASLQTLNERALGLHHHCFWYKWSTMRTKTTIGQTPKEVSTMLEDNFEQKAIQGVSRFADKKKMTYVVGARGAAQSVCSRWSLMGDQFYCRA